MATVWETRDRLGRDVALTDEGWAQIVARRGALALPSTEIRDAIEDPDFVNADVGYPRRENHDRRSGSSRSYLKVVVNDRPVPPQGTWVGEVVTADRTGIVPRNEQRRWP